MSPKKLRQALWHNAGPTSRSREWTAEYATRETENRKKTKDTEVKKGKLNKRGKVRKEMKSGGTLNIESGTSNFEVWPGTAATTLSAWTKDARGAENRQHNTGYTY